MVNFTRFYRSVNLIFSVYSTYGLYTLQIRIILFFIVDLQGILQYSYLVHVNNAIDRSKKFNSTIKTIIIQCVACYETSRTHKKIFFDKTNIIIYVIFYLSSTLSLFGTRFQVCKVKIRDERSAVFYWSRKEISRFEC